MNNNNNISEAGSPAIEESNGTTTVGIKTDDGVIVATDRKASSFITTTKKDTNKIMKIHPTAVLTMAGSVGDSQKLHHELRNKVSTYKSKRGRNMPIKSIPYVMRNIFENNHYHVEPIVAGVDKTGNYLYVVEANGSIIQFDEYTSTGSGLPFAIGVLEQGYANDLSLEEAKELAFNAIKTASERDNFTGNGIIITTITNDGIDTNTYDSVQDKL